jgi:hypothetical protein
VLKKDDLSQRRGSLRTGPLVRRGAKVSRAPQANSSTLRASAATNLFTKRPLGQNGFPAAVHLFKSSCLRLEYRLPINLREFLANQLGAVVDESDETVLNLAATADECTLSRLARAIRRYSTTRAQQSWQEFTIPLARFVADQETQGPNIALCLKCALVEFGQGALERHQGAGCVSLALGGASAVERHSGAQEVKIADAVRRLIEEFRALRVAFGLPHFELDSYVRNGQVTFTWRPLS